MSDREYLDILQILANSSDSRVRNDASARLGAIQQAQERDRKEYKNPFGEETR